MRNERARYEISMNGVPHSYRSRTDIAIQTGRFVKSRNPNSVTTLKGHREREQ